MLQFLVLIALVVGAALLAAVFAWLNPGTVTLDLAFAQVESPLALAFIVALTCGFLMGSLSTLGHVLRLLREQRRLKRSLRLAEGELEALRSLPVHEPPSQAQPPLP